MKGGNKIKDFLAAFFSEKWWKLKYHDAVEGNGRAKWTVFIFKKRLQYNIPVQVCDAWHFSKMLMVFALCFATVL